MQEDNGRLSFGVGLDLSQLSADATKSKEMLASIGQAATREGSVIDSAFSQTGAAKGIAALEAAVRGAAKEIQGLDFGTASEKIGALSEIIRANEQVIADNANLLQKWQADATAAFAAGDTGTFEAITADIDEQTKKLDELTAETDTYRGALQAVMAVQGMDTQAVSVPRLYKSEEDMAAVEQLKEQIRATAAELQQVAADGGDTKALTADLTSLQDQLATTETQAAQAASALGEDLGGRAAEAQGRLHDLNQAVAEQQDKLATITEAAEQARAAYEELAASNTSTSEQVEAAAATLDTLRDSVSNATDRLTALQTAQASAQASWNSVSQEVATHDSVMVKMLGGYDNYKTILDKLPAPVKMAIDGVAGMTGAAKAFIATPLGATIAAIMLALQALKTWFNSTAEGQMAFAKISGYVSGVLGQLKEIVITVGKTIFNAFSNPKKAITDLWNAIKTNIVNRFKSIGVIAGALGKVIKAAFTFNWDAMKSGLKELADGWLQFGTGVEHLTDKVGKYVKGVHNASKESAAIAAESKQLDIEVSKWQKKNQQLKTEKDKARGKLYNRNLSTAERKKARDDFERALQEQTEMEAKFADKRINLQMRTMALTSNTIEDENKLRDLQAAKEAVRTRKAQEMAMLQRRSNSLDSKDNTAAKQAGEQRKQAEQALKALGETEAALIIENNRRRTELMEEGAEKSLQQLKDQQAQEEDQLKQKAEKLKELNQKAGKGDRLTDSQQKAVDDATALIAEKYTRLTNDIANAEARQLQDYIKQYGTFQEQKLAIAAEYAAKIAKVNQSTLTDEQKQWQIKGLQAEQKSKQDALEAKAVTQSVDWYAVFSNVGDIMGKAVRPVLEQLKAYAGSDAYKNLAPEQQKVIAEAIAKMRKATGTNTDIGWRDLAADLTEYQKALQEAQAAQQLYADAQEAYAEEIAGLVAKLSDPGTSKEDAQAAQNRLNEINKLLHPQAEASEKAGEKVKTAGAKLASTVEDVAKPVDELSTFLGKAGLGQLKTLYDDLLSIKGGIEGLKGLKAAKEVAKDLQGAGKEIAQATGEAAKDAGKGLQGVFESAGFIGQIVSAVLSILDILKDGIGTLISSLIDTVMNAVTGILQNLLSGDFAKQIFQSLGKGLQGIADAVTFGGFSSLFGTNGNAAEVARTTQRLTDRNAALQKSIDALKDTIDKSAGGKALDAYQQAIKDQREYNENLRQVLNAQMKYHNAHGSNASKWEIWAEFNDAINNLLGTHLRRDSWEDYRQLTPEQMDQIRTHLPSAWANMLAQGKYNKSEYFENYADQAGKIEELTAKIRENLLGTTVDGLADSFADQLMDMDRSSKDFANDFTETIQKAMLRATIADHFKDRIAKWYEDITNRMGVGTDQYAELTNEEIDTFRGQWQQMVDDLMAERDRLAQITGYKGNTEDQRNGISKGIATASQDSVDELNGRMTAVQSHTYSIAESTRLMLTVTQDILRGVNNIDRQTLSTANSVEAVKADTQEMKEALQDITTKGVKIR